MLLELQQLRAMTSAPWAHLTALAADEHVMACRGDASHLKGQWCTKRIPAETTLFSDAQVDSGQCAQTMRKTSAVSALPKPL